MRIIVKAKTRAKVAKVERLDQAVLPFGAGINRSGEEVPTYSVSVTEAPVAGKANDAIRRALAEHLGVAPSSVHLVSGATSRQKVFEVE